MSIDKFNPLVTVYIPTYNRLELLKRAVESVRNQTYKNIEIIIVDDCSKDGTHKYLEEISRQDSRIRYFIKEKNSGACVSRNIAIENAQGEFITGLDDDDYFTKDRIQKFLDKSDFLNKYEFLFDTFYLKNNGELKKIKFDFLKPRIVNFNDLLMGNYVGNQIFTKTDRLRESGGFDSNLSAWQDLELWMNLLKKGKESYNIKKYTYIVDIDHPHERITSKSKDKKIFKVYSYIAEKYNLSHNQKGMLATHMQFYGIHVDLVNYIRFPLFQYKAIYFMKFLSLLKTVFLSKA
ncbi:glycosyltransferase [Acinetobacter indicus]|uniref:glycosyltransferase n=1 Tax=Acinetobacter indicus TaxID=756892 RepID=UPI00143FBD15|nr:glycosyltransferase [Acinetobacter indicus]QIZ59035.1 glycosyltransferase [Acinetobacter indicus]